MKKKKLLLWVSVGIALALVIVLACIFLPKIQKQIASKSEHQQYYDNKCQSYAVQNTNLAKGQIVFIGDSITDLYVLDNHYADLPLAAYNRGIGGDTTQGVLNRLQVSIFDIHPSVIVLMIGTNDVNGGVDNSEILQNYTQIIDGIYEALPEVELFCMSVIPQNEQLETYTTINVEKTTKAILALNEDLKDLVQARGATYLDLFPLLADENDRLIAEYSDDGIHLNEQGFVVWRDLLKPYLLDLLAEVNP